MNKIFPYLSRECTLPKIEIMFHGTEDDPHHRLFTEMVYYTLQQILPLEVISCGDEPELFLKKMKSIIPFISFITCKKAPGKMSFYFFAEYRANTFKFFYEMVSRWLIPGKRLNVVLVHAIDFWLPELSRQIYTICEVTICVEEQMEIEEIQKNLSIIEAEVRLGLASPYHARRILEIKGLSNDEKTALIQEHIALLIDRLPKAFDIGIFADMQHLLVMCREDFKQQRSSHHLSKIIAVQYYYRKQLRSMVKERFSKRHVRLKIFKGVLTKGHEKKEIVALALCFNFLSDNEDLDQTHVLKAVQRYFPKVQLVENSFLVNRRANDPICTLYLEIQPTNPALPFTLGDIRMLIRELPGELESHISHLVQPVFMPRNEEEIMRNIFSLSNQIRYVRDIPQVFISFDEQTNAHLIFTVILVRVMRYDYPSIEDMFRVAKTTMEYIHDRCREVGFLRKKYPKEAAVFRLKFPKNPFIRLDRSVDLYKARQVVVSELMRIVGDVRDYNGGMISKQTELLERVRKALKGDLRYHDFMLENFFFSLTPVIMRTLLDPEALKQLFVMMHDLIPRGGVLERPIMKILCEPTLVFVGVAAADGGVEMEVGKILRQLDLDSVSLAHSSVKISGSVHLSGYIYRCSDLEEQREFCLAIQPVVL